ncbi:hypothetical protein JTB14_001517 [Gonioctena quinquepunctata]|nr:hypothetical protein JTB14_001517 [Gonioctena quinquepunctata]
MQESSSSPLDFDESDEDTNCCDAINVRPENIRDDCFILVKFEKKTSVVYHVRKVFSHYSSTELKVSYLRKKLGSSWSFVFPDVEDIHTLYNSDIAMIFPDPKPLSYCTARMSRLLTFPIDSNDSEQ